MEFKVRYLVTTLFMYALPNGFWIDGEKKICNDFGKVIPDIEILN